MIIYFLIFILVVFILYSSIPLNSSSSFIFGATNDLDDCENRLKHLRTELNTKRKQRCNEKVNQILQQIDSLDNVKDVIKD